MKLVGSKQSCLFEVNLENSICKDFNVGSIDLEVSYTERVLLEC